MCWALDCGIDLVDTANVYGATPAFDRPGAPPATEREPAEELLGRVEGNRIVGRWEASDDEGATWRKDFGLLFERR